MLTKFEWGTQNAQVDMRDHNFLFLDGIRVTVNNFGKMYVAMRIRPK